MDSRNKHRISRISSIVTLWSVCLFLLFGSPQYSWGQGGLTISSINEQQLVVEYSLPDIKAKPTDMRHCILHSSSTNSYSHEPGRPMLPQHREIIATGNGLTTVSITEQKWDTLNLSDLDCNMSIQPYKGANAKETELIPADEDSIYYAIDSLMGKPLITVETLGLMRGTPLAMLTISPVRYNPASSSITICRRLKATISFSEKKDDIAPNPMLLSLPKNMSHNTKNYVNTLLQDSIPQLFQVVSTTHFRETLQPLLTWKRQEGYIVDELYFDQCSTIDVKDSLQSRYNNATPDHPAPLFILLVGDMDDIPLWSPHHIIQGLESHRTDFYYAEFTGDMLPDALIGRISVRDTTELRHVIEKTLAYEKGEIMDTSALRRSLLVAGKEETHPAPTVTNGQINYVKKLLIAHDPEHDTFCYYNPESANQRNEILDVLRQGVGMMNYTSHCTSKGWRDPLLNNMDINNTNVVDSQLFIAINNCCRSNDVAGECFGEQLLRKPQGGAVGAIGASNETLWEEDYYWSVGFGNISCNPSPDSTTAGAFDRLLHPYLQMPSEQSWTLGQIILAGNNAVTASGSQFANFYWEIYLLLGDPSLMPHIGPLLPMSLYCDSIQLGDTALLLTGTPWARVAATCGDTLLGLCTLDANGEATMHFRQPVASNTCITATRQFHRAKQIHFNFIVDTTSHEAVCEALNDNIRIYPNPTHNHITINGLNGPTNIAFFDSMGRLLLKKKVTNGQPIFLKSIMSHGIYTLMIFNPDGTRTVKKIVIDD